VANGLWHILCIVDETYINHLCAIRRLPLDSGGRSSVRYLSHLRHDESQMVALIRTYAEEQPMYGYRINAAMLKQDGHQVNRKRVYRIWRQEGLQLPRRRTVKRCYGDSTGRLQRATWPNEVWSYDFLESRKERGGKLRMLTILDGYTSECLVIHVARSISSRQVKLAFSRPGTPTDNPFIEAFNGRFRQECLDQNWFASLDDARTIIEAWRKDYNMVRPHSSLDQLTPAAYKEKWL
jgi:putative transposase